MTFYYVSGTKIGQEDKNEKMIQIGSQRIFEREKMESCEEGLYKS